MSKVEFLIKEALCMSPEERATIAHCLISSIDEPSEENVEKEWLELAQKRLAEIDNKEVQPVSWQEIKKRIRTS